ncbi:MAG: hypothetical protein RL112_2712 [Planctomycetota bacterium]
MSAATRADGRRRPSCRGSRAGRSLAASQCVARMLRVAHQARVADAARPRRRGWSSQRDAVSPHAPGVTRHRVVRGAQHWRQAPDARLDPDRRAVGSPPRGFAASRKREAVSSKLDRRGVQLAARRRRTLAPGRARQPARRVAGASKSATLDAECPMVVGVTRDQRGWDPRVDQVALLRLQAAPHRRSPWQGALQSKPMFFHRSRMRARRQAGAYLAIGSDGSPTRQGPVNKGLAKAAT